jgi:uncharacterized DUF497 family protein
VRFEWDARKAARNLQVHGVSFDEAASTWLFDAIAEHFDGAHSGDEERWVRVGISKRGRLLVVSLTRRRGTIRLISARRATKRERHGYEAG